MTRPEAKADELRDVLEMIDLLPLDVSGPPIEHERPDFRLVLASGRRIGLEHTRAIDGTIAPASGVADRLRNRVQQGLVEAGIPAHINFTISEGAAAVLNSMRRELAAEVAALVKLAGDALAEPLADGESWKRYEILDDIVNHEGEVVWRDPARARGVRDLARTGVEFCSAVMVRPDHAPFAGCNRTAHGQRANIIQDAIDDKAELLDVYRQSGDDEQWLLVVGSARTGGALDIHEADGEFISPFDRTIFLERFEGACVELRTRGS